MYSLKIHSVFHTTLKTVLHFQHDPLCGIRETAASQFKIVQAQKGLCKEKQTKLYQV